MINIEEAKQSFKKYVSQFDENDIKNQVKTRHTLSVLQVAGVISERLGLDKENIELAKLIGLLHDIGRFEQEEKYKTFDDTEECNHAKIGADLLFNRGLIREFVKEDTYDEIIRKAILNHNKYELKEDELSEIELLHCKIIRDADKTDNFLVKQYQDLKSLLGKTMEEAEKERITDGVWQQFLNKKTIISSTRITAMDHWLSYLAWIYDYNFTASLEYVEEKGLLDGVLDRIDYKDSDTKTKMDYARKTLHQYISERIR